MIVGITGAGGFVGRQLTQAFAERGHRIVALSSSGAVHPASESVRPYELDGDISAGMLDGLDAMVHSAYIVATPKNPNASVRNVAGTLRLERAARAAGLPFVFLSSLSAHRAARSEYGLYKFAVEMELAKSPAFVVRPGLVIGDGGLVRNLALAQRRGIVPMIDGGRQRVYIVGPNDLANGILTVLARGLRGPVTACAEESVTLSHIAVTMATRLGLRPRYVHVPWRAAYVVAWAAEHAGVPLPLTTENLLGMRVAPARVQSRELSDCGWRARGWDELVATLSIGPA